MGTGKTLLLHLIYVLLLGGSIAYLNEFRFDESIPNLGNRVGYLEDVLIKIYGRNGVEWNVEGKRLYSIGVDVLMDDLNLSSEEYVIKATRGRINRLSGKGSIEGKVEIKGEALFIKTQKANIDLKRKKIWGSGIIEVWRYENYVSGKGYEVFLSPLRVIIKEVKTKHDA